MVNYNEIYRFPPNHKALEASKLQMGAKLMEECAEVCEAIATKERSPRVLEELADVIQVVEGLQRAYGNETAVRASYGMVYAKCRRRGDYSA